MILKEARTTMLNIRNGAMAAFLMLVAFAVTPAIAQPCGVLDNGQPRPKTMIDRMPECGGTAPTIEISPDTLLAPGSQNALIVGSLTTLFAANNSFAGNTFDLEVLGSMSLVITGFDINIGTLGNSNTVTVYYKLGTAVGFENNPAAWTIMGSDASVIAAGPNLPTSVNVSGLTMDPGQIYGIYVDLTSYPSAPVGYTNGGPTIFANADLQLTTNTGQTAPAFSGSFFPRQWNGTVHYATATAATTRPFAIPTLNTMGLAVLILLLVGAIVLIHRRRNV